MDNVYEGETPFFFNQGTRKVCTMKKKTAFTFYSTWCHFVLWRHKKKRMKKGITKIAVPTCSKLIA